jgi:prevent-host-death family protein
MATEISIDALGPELKGLLERSPSGEPITVLGKDGKPVARLTPLRPEPEPPMSDEEWFAKWDALAERIDKAWKSDKTALEVLAEMRR